MTGEAWSPDQLVATNEDAAAFFRRQLLGPAGHGPRRYLTERGFEALLDETIWTVGYAPASWTALHDHLCELGYSDDCQQAAGVVTTSRHGRPIDRFRDRITFGVRDLHTLTGFVARTSPSASSATPKYLNTPTTAIYNKSETLFGLGEQATLLRSSAPPVLVEGPLDAIAIHLASSPTGGSHIGLALCGTALTDKHLDNALVGAPSSATLFFDPDTAGRAAMKHAYQRLHPRIGNVNATNRATSSDPADTFQRGGTASLLDELSKVNPAADVIVQAQLDSWPTAKTGAEADLARLRELAKLIADLPYSDVARQAARLREHLPFDDKTIARELVDAVTTARTRETPVSAGRERPRTAKARVQLTGS